MQLALFSDVGPLETIAENKTEQKSAAKRRQRLLKAGPTAAKLGCAFSHSVERIVDELVYFFPPVWPIRTRPRSLQLRKQ